jgi:hypothetical protein
MSDCKEGNCEKFAFILKCQKCREVIFREEISLLKKDKAVLLETVNLLAKESDMYMYAEEALEKLKGMRE